jgi:hypothetical protein
MKGRSRTHSKNATTHQHGSFVKYANFSEDLGMTLPHYTGRKQARRRKQLVLTYLMTLAVVITSLVVFLSIWFTVKIVFRLIQS